MRIELWHQEDTALMDEVYVVEVATTGVNGCPRDRVAEIAVCKVSGRDFETVYFETLALDPLDLGKESLDYMSETFGIEPESLYAGIEEDAAVSAIQKIIFGKYCTSYTVGNVFGRYLSFEPWDATRNVTLLPALSARLPQEFKGAPWEEPIRLAEAYRAFCPDDPAQVGEGRRAIHLAQMASSVLLDLKDRGMYRFHSIGAGTDRSNHSVEKHDDVHYGVDDPQRNG